MSAGHGRSRALHGAPASVDVAHALAPVPVLYAPEAHSAHALAPTADAYAPGAQAAQDAPEMSPVPVAKAPAVQAGAQAVALAA